MQTYKPVSGFFFMGSPLSSITANLFMKPFEERYRTIFIDCIIVWIEFSLDHWKNGTEYYLILLN